MELIPKDKTRLQLYIERQGRLHKFKRSFNYYVLPVVVLISFLVFGIYIFAQIYQTLLKQTSSNVSSVTSIPHLNESFNEFYSSDNATRRIDLDKDIRLILDKNTQVASRTLTSSFQSLELVSGRLFVYKPSSEFKIIIKFSDLHIETRDATFMVSNSNGFTIDVLSGNVKVFDRVSNTHELGEFMHWDETQKTPVLLDKTQVLSDTFIDHSLRDLELKSLYEQKQ